MDDMNATPLDKLPPPVMQTKMDQPKMDSAPTYTDILHDMDIRKNQMPDQSMQQYSAAQAQQQQQVAYAQQQTMGPPPDHQYTAPVYQQQHPHQQQHQSQYMPPQYYETHGPPQQYACPQPLPPAIDQVASKSPLIASLWTSNKLTLIVAGIVLILLWMVIPRFKTMPRFTHDGLSLNVLGTATTALLGAVTFKIASHFA